VRVLHVTPAMPYWPGGDGGATRQFHLLRRLVETGHDVVCVAPAHETQVARIPGVEAAGIRLEAVHRPRSRWAESARAIAREPALVPRAASAPLLAWQVSVFWSYLRPVARRVAREWRPDVLSVEHDWAAAWARDLPGELPAVLTLDNVSWRYYESRARAAPPHTRLIHALEARRFRRFDARHLAAYRALVTTSELDAARVAEELPLPVSVVPNGVAADEIVPLPEAAREPTLLFTGTLGYAPNAEGIEWFVREAWPRVRARQPEARLLVVGRDPGARVRRLGDEAGVEVLGPAESLGPYFERATAVVTPLLSGSGTRLKVLEALAAGRAVVSTSTGAEGIEVESGRHLLVADGGEAFADATLRVLEDADLRAGLAREGRELVEERYDWRVLGDRFAEVLASVVQGVPAR
jgi:polysaccharide biosynthesis protein PslH